MIPPILEPAVLSDRRPSLRGHSCRGRSPFLLFERYRDPGSWWRCERCGEDGQPYVVHAALPELVPFSEMDLSLFPRAPVFDSLRRLSSSRERARIMGNIRNMTLDRLRGIR
jgi:hypothetical protein